jgi:AraC-like DNA-binding protein
VFVTSGSVQVAQKGFTESASAGQVIVGNANIPHSSGYHCTEEVCAGVTITLAAEGLADWFPDFGYSEKQQPVLLGKLDAPDLLPTALRLVRESGERRPGYRPVLEGLSRVLAAEVFRRWPAGLISLHPVNRRIRQLPRHQFVKAVEYMNSCTKEEFRLQQLCETVGSSASRFTQLFTASTRSRPLPFFNRLIVERAKHQLSTTERPVKDVAYALGFRSVSHFSTLFKSVAGVSPQEQRRLSRGLLEPTSVGTSTVGCEIPQAVPLRLIRPSLRKWA